MSVFFSINYLAFQLIRPVFGLLFLPLQLTPCFFEVGEDFETRRFIFCEGILQ